MEYFAIKHVPSGGFLPQPKNGRGGTHVAPTTKLPPRLFTRELDARNCLTWWLRGKIHTTYIDAWEEESWHVQKMADRHREDMEIVKFKLEPADA